MAYSLCLKCGFDKDSPFERCDRCGFSPIGDNMAMVKSRMLSQNWTTDDGEPVRSLSELKEISKNIKDGHEIFFDEIELRRLMAEKETLDSGSHSPERISIVLLIMVLVLFSPLIIAIAIHFFSH